jgi:FtsH-binding integral membrane protein
MNAEDLDWLLVLLMRRNWTSLSFTVFSAFLWTLASVSGTGITSSLWWMLTLATVVGLGVWLWTRRQINKVNSNLSGRTLVKSCNIDSLVDC